VDKTNSGEQLSSRKTAKVRVVEEAGDVAAPERRLFLQTLASQGLLIPAAYFLAPSGLAHAHAALLDDPKNPIVARPPSAAGIIRDFSDPYIELIRLLHEACEVEHALMVQYLFAAFSVKPAYASIVCFGIPTSNDLLGVAVQEMQHLGKVNALLVALGASPSFVREDLPYEPEIYPFEFKLESLTQSSLAKYVYAEAPSEALDRKKAVTPADKKFLDLLERMLGSNRKYNHLGGLYANIISVLKEYIASPEENARTLEPWIAKLEDIKNEGENEHFRFFKQLFTGTHKAFAGHPDIWALKPDHPSYPSRLLADNPSAYVGHPTQIQDPTALALAWLGNLHYWTILLMVDHSYRAGQTELSGLGRAQMMGPFVSLARHLPTLGVGMPFDPLTTGYGPGQGSKHNLKFLACMVGEADKLAHKLKPHLPPDYPLGMGQETLAALSDLKARTQLAGSPTQ
jgi:rubrerythrin